MGSTPKTRIVEISELIRQTEKVWCVRLKRTGETAWISADPKIMVDMLPGPALVIADWYYQKRIRHLNEATPVENAF